MQILFLYHFTCLSPIPKINGFVDIGIFLKAMLIFQLILLRNGKNISKIRIFKLLTVFYPTPI